MGVARALATEPQLLVRHLGDDHEHAPLDTEFNLCI
jgi:ABC-type taurine transport system ATPase subunit